MVGPTYSPVTKYPQAARDGGVRRSGGRIGAKDNSFVGPQGAQARIYARRE